jgi:hypothetical protein
MSDEKDVTLDISKAAIQNPFPDPRRKKTPPTKPSLWRRLWRFLRGNHAS